MEKFYLANGFLPACYKIETDGTYVKVKDFCSPEDYVAYRRPSGNGFVVMEKRW